MTGLAAGIKAGLFFGVFIALWQGAIAAFAIPHFVIPSPAATGFALWQNRAEIGAALGVTLTGAGLGVLLAFALALILAGTFTLSPRAARALMPLVIGVRTAPVLAIAPLLILIFGRDQGTTIAVVVIVAFFPILVNTMRGLRAVNPLVKELFHVIGASRWQVFIKARLPFALPFIFTGLRAAAASALLSAMLAEWLSGSPGLGKLILDASSYRDMPKMFAAVGVSMAMAFALFALTVRLERRTAAL